MLVLYHPSRLVEASNFSPIEVLDTLNEPYLTQLFTSLIRRRQAQILLLPLLDEYNWTSSEIILLLGNSWMKVTKSDFNIEMKVMVCDGGSVNEYQIIPGLVVQSGINIHELVDPNVKMEGMTQQKRPPTDKMNGPLKRVKLEDYKLDEDGKRRKQKLDEFNAPYLKAIPLQISALQEPFPLDSLGHKAKKRKPKLDLKY